MLNLKPRHRGLGGQRLRFSDALIPRSRVRNQRDPTSFAEIVISQPRVSQSRVKRRDSNSNERTPAAVNQWMSREEEDLRARFEVTSQQPKETRTFTTKHLFRDFGGDGRVSWLDVCIRGTREIECPKIKAIQRHLYYYRGIWLSGQHSFLNHLRLSRGNIKKMIYRMCVFR